MPSPGRHRSSLLLAAVAPAAFLLWLTFSDQPAAWPFTWGLGLLAALGASWTTARAIAPHERFLDYLRRTADLHIVVAGLTLGLALQSVLNEGVTSDGCLYFAHLRSLIFDGDLAIGPELEVLNLPPRPSHVVTFGAAVVWVPLYLLVRVADAMGLVDQPGTLPGLGGPYIRAALISSYLVAGLGLFALHMRLRREFGGLTALCASTLLFAATPLVWYAIYEPSMTHAASFGLVAFFLLGSERWRWTTPSPQFAAGLGVLYSLILAIRPQDGLFGIFLLAAIASTWKDRARFPSHLRSLAWFAAGAAPFTAIQVGLLSALMARQPFTFTGDRGYLHFFDSRWLDALFSSRHGFFSWTPVAYLAALGAVFYVARDRVWALSALVVLAAMSWVNGSADDWWGGWAFGGRRFTSTLAALAPGLALAIDWVRRRPMVAVAPMLAAALGWNVLLMLQYHHERIPRDQPVAFDTMTRQQLDLAIERTGVYPFAFPANAWFAWREDLPIGRYDLLAPEELRAQLLLPLDATNTRFLLDGWGEPATDALGTFSPIRDDEATVAIPLAPPRAPPLTLEFEASTAPAAQPVRVRVRVAVNGHILGDVDIGPDRDSFTFAGTRPDLPRTLWRTGYNRIAFRKLSVRAIGDDPSRAAAASRPSRWPVAVYLVRVEPRPVGFSR